MKKYRLVIPLMALFTTLLSFAASAQPADPSDKVTISTQWSHARAHPGAQEALAVIIDLPKELHINPSAAQLPPDSVYIPTLVSAATTSKAVRLGKPQYPAPHPVKVQYESAPLPVYSGKVVVYVPVVIDDSAVPGEVALDIEVSFQACDDSACFMPRSLKTSATLSVVPLDQPIPPAGHAELFARFDGSVFAVILAGQVAPPTAGASGGGPSSSILNNDFFGLKFTIDTRSTTGLLLVLAVAFIAGVLLNFTPCVLPVIPIKVMSLHHHAGNPARSLQLGTVFCLGIVATFGVLGALVAGLVSGLDRLEWGQVFSYAPVSVALGVIIIAMALGMFDVFTLRLPQSLYMFQPSGDTIGGNVGLGVLTAVLSTPCTGPMLGATIAWAVKQPAYLSVGAFLMMGVGMAAPYLLLAANPKWVDRLPRTGPGSVLVKQVMGLFLLAVATFFLGPILPGPYEWWVIALFISASMVWMMLRTSRITKKMAPRVVVTFIGVGVMILSLALARQLTSQGPIPWQPYSQSALDKSLQQGDTVLLEFTADWCGNCKALELTTYRSAELADIMHSPGYSAYKIDLTSTSNAEGWAMQKRYGGGGGIPLAVVINKDGPDKPVAVLQGLFTPDQLISALRQK